jgi:hypothetical protein
MSFHPSSAAAAAPDLANAEARMRQALGLQDGPALQPPQRRPDQARPRRGSVQDGKTPVIVLNSRGDRGANPSPRNRVVAVEAALEAERAARASAERSLQEALTLIQSLQTKLAHAELAHSEALAAERKKREYTEPQL